MKIKKEKKKKKKLLKLILDDVKEAKKIMKYSNTPLSPAFISDELLAEILSFLDVKNIVQLKCVSKSWNTLISDPTFVEKHLKKSSQKPRLLLTPRCWTYPIASVKSFPVRHLVKNPSSTVCFPLRGYNCSKYPISSRYKVVNSYNGLLCLLFISLNMNYNIETCSFCLWNPATRTKSVEFGTFKEAYNPRSLFDSLEFIFGCDILNGIYKVIAFQAERDNGDALWRCQVRVLSLGDNCWRNINSFPVIPLISPYNNGVHLSGTVSWLALQKHLSPLYNYMYINHVEKFVIVSLDLSTEEYTQFLLPSGFFGVPCFQPTLQVLMDCLCFSYDLWKTEFVIWQMKEFGIQDSWTQLCRIKYFNLEMRVSFFESSTPVLLPLYLSKNENTLILADCVDDQTIIYNQRKNRVERIKNSNKVCRFSHIDSLVSTHLKYVFLYHLQ